MPTFSGATGGNASFSKTPKPHDDLRYLGVDTNPSRSARSHLRYQEGSGTSETAEPAINIFVSGRGILAPDRNRGGERVVPGHENWSEFGTLGAPAPSHARPRWTPHRPNALPNGRNAVEGRRIAVEECPAYLHRIALRQQALDHHSGERVSDVLPCHHQMAED